MAAITANLLAAAAPPLNPTVNPAAQTGTSTQPTSRSGFADVLTQATTGTPSPTPSTPLADPGSTERPTEPGESPELVATALAAIGLIQQTLPNQVQVLPLSGIPASAVATTATVTAQSVATTADTAAVPTAPATTPTASRTEQLRFEAAPAARGTPNTPTVPTPLPALSPTVTTEPTPSAALVAQTSTTASVIPTPPLTSVATSPSDVIPAAARTPTVVAQVPLVAERSQQLPALQPELGYSLVGPTVDGPQPINPVAGVGGTPSQGQVEVLAAGLPPVEPPAPKPDVQTPQPGGSFADVFTNRATPNALATAPTARDGPQLGVATAAEIPPLLGRPTDTQPDRTRAVNTLPTAAPTTATRLTSASPAETQPATAEPMRSSPAGTPPGDVPTPAGVVESAGLNRSVPVERPFAPTGGSPTSAASEGRPPIVAVPVPAERAEADSSTPTTAPAAVPQTRPAEPTPPDSPRVNSTPTPVAAQVSEAFVGQARVIERGGRHEFQLRLDPPELGEVKVRVLAMGDKVEARLVVSDDAVRRLIESQLPELRQRLEQAGVSVPRFDVTTDGGRANTGGDTWDRPQPLTPARTAPAPAAPNTRPGSGGLLDVTA